MKMQRLFTIILILLIAGSSYAGQHEYTVGLYGGLSRLSGDEPYRFPFQKNYGLEFQYRLNDQWRLHFDLSRHSLHNDTLGAVTLSLWSDDKNSSHHFKATRLGVIADRLLWKQEYKARITAGMGGGLLVWSVEDPSTGGMIQVPGINNQTIE